MLQMSQVPVALLFPLDGLEIYHLPGWILCTAMPKICQLFVNSHAKSSVKRDAEFSD